MITYYITTLLVLFFTYLAQKNIIIINDIESKKTIIKKPSITKFFYFMTAITLIFFAGFRYRVGTDYAMYEYTFQNRVTDFVENSFFQNEPGYSFLCWITSLFGGNFATVVFLTSVITILLFVITIYKNTDMLLSTSLLYVFLGCWHGAFNGIRQYLAAAIVFAGLRFIKERKFWKYAVVVFIAFLFHSSAIMMIFVYFIAYNKISFQNILFLISISLIVLFSFTEVLEFTGFLLNENLSDEGAYLTRSVNMFRILVAIAPAVFFLLLYQNKPINQEQRFWFNTLIINGVMMFATSNSAYLARIGIYTAPFSAIGISELIKGVNPKEKKLITTIILIAFAAFWLYEISNSSSLNHFTFIWQK